MSCIPQNILSAARALLEPYGIDLERLLQNAKQQTSNTKKEGRYLSIKQVEQNYGIGRWTIWRLIKSGQIKSVKMQAAKSGKVLVNMASLEKFFNKKERA